MPYQNRKLELVLSESSKNNSSHSEYKNRDIDSNSEYDGSEEVEAVVYKDACKNELLWTKPQKTQEDN